VVREAAALGAKFRIAGGSVAINGDAALPQTLRGELVEVSNSGLLRSFLLSGDDPDIAAVAFADRLGVERVLVETRTDARQAIRQLLCDIHDHADHIVSLDIETVPRLGAPRPTVQFTKDTIPTERQPAWQDKEGLNPYHADIATLQLYAGGKCAYLFRGEALKIVIGSHWLRRQHLVLHNALFDTAFIQHHSQYRRPAFRRSLGRFECTQQAAGLLRGVGFAGERRKLEIAARDFLGFDVPKKLQVSDWDAPILSQGQIAYACTDAISTWRLWPLMKAELRARQRWDAYVLQRGAIPAVADMELRGLGVDREAHAAITRRWAEELAEARHAYQELTGEAPPSKDADVRAWITHVLAKDPDRLARWPRTPTGLLSTRTEHIQRLADIPSARPILGIKAHEQLLRNFAAEWIAKVSPATGRLHCHYNISGSKSGRFSANNPNLQQLPGQKAPEFKHCIVADPGNLLVGCDYNQIEMRAAAWLYDDRALTAVYAEGRDLHTEAVTFIVGVRPDQVTPEQRQKAKALNFGAIFGIGAASLQQYAFANYGAEMTLQEAQNALDRFFNTYRQLKRGLRRNYDVCKARGYIEIGCGRIIEAAWETETGGTLRYTLCANAPVQGICADAILRAIIWTHARLKKAGIRGGLVACVHDELLLEVHQADAEAARGILQQAMLDAFIETFPGAPTNGVVKAEIGRTWAEVK
jgi:DNA polymerase-1